METKELMGFIKTEHNRLLKYYNVDEKSQLKYPMTIKIMEELGELCDEILYADKLQRTDKLEKRQSKLDEEFADVILTTLLLAENMDVDVMAGLKKKIETIKARNY